MKHLWPALLLVTTLASASQNTVLSLLAAPRLEVASVEPDRVSEEQVVVPLLFPVVGDVTWQDNFLVARSSKRRHLGQDLMAPKMTQLVACFDGIVILHPAKTPGGHNWLTLRGYNGWSANYMHMNNDTPGTDDGLGSDLYAFAPGLHSGQHVQAGQFLGYVGDSGNAEEVAPHCHFELWDSVTRSVINAAPSLAAANSIAPLPPYFSLKS